LEGESKSDGWLQNGKTIEDDRNKSSHQT
jgi:hypothetical protein